MFPISKLRNHLGPNICIMLQTRSKSKEHWAKLRRKTSPKYKALSHFDDFYGSVFGKQWEPMRDAMLRKCKYVAVVNHYGDAEETVRVLRDRGAHCLGELMSIQKKFNEQYMQESNKTIIKPSDNNLENYIERLQSDDISSLYPQKSIIPETLNVNEITIGTKRTDAVKEKRPLKSRTLEEQLEDAVIDESRIIEPSMDIATDALYQYIPATKLKGMDDWVPESLHYSYYSKDTDFPLSIEPEAEFQYPEYLKVYTYEMDSDLVMFPEPKRCQTGVFNYYPMDCGSVLAVLALCLSPGDRVLDMCAAPGGKAFVALQTLLPDILVCNDSSISRTNRLQRIFKDYLYDFETSNKWRERVLITKLDGRNFVDDQGFDKVLVDVPCTTDRHSVMEDENNIFRPDRVRERLKIPELQSQLLIKALNLVKVGGAVVYSTCSLSPVQNDGVVHMALKQAFESNSIVATIKDLTASMSGFSSTLKLANNKAAPKYGQLVLPSVSANFGPSYIARLVRVR